MRNARARIVRVLVEYFDADDRRLEHALSVLYHAERSMETSPGCDREILLASALLHDVGIKVAEEKHGHSGSKAQEEYGRLVAGELLDSIAFPPDKTKIVKEIIGNHHSPSRFDYLELEVLKEADRIVNRGEKV